MVFEQALAGFKTNPGFKDLTQQENRFSMVGQEGELILISQTGRYIVIGQGPDQVKHHQDGLGRKLKID